MIKIIIPVLSILLLSCDFLGGSCDDCIHSAIKLIIHDKASGAVITSVDSIIVDFENTTYTLVASPEDRFPDDFVYHIDGEAGNYRLTAILTGYDTIQINNISVKRNKCNVITKVITVGATENGSGLSKTASDIINIKESGDCG